MTMERTDDDRLPEEAADDLAIDEVDAGSLTDEERDEAIEIRAEIEETREEMGGTYGSFDEREVIEAINRALDLGITLYDTALVYGFDPERVPFDTDPSAGAGRSE